LVPILKVAAKGEATAPIRPDPKPLTNPLAPSSFAFLYGFVNIPVNPLTSSSPPPLSP